MTIYAHRGLHGPDRPENGKAALIAAQMAGYGFETDLRLTRDGVPVLFHDRVVGRVGRSVRDIDHANLNAIMGYEVPTLEWLMERQWRLPINLEIKTMEAWHASAEALRSWRIPGDLLLISSFDHGVAEQARAMDMNGARLYANAPAPGDPIPEARSRLASMVLDINIATPEHIDRLQDGDHVVYVYGAQTAEEHERLFELQVDCVITDHPEMARDAGYRMDS